VGPGATHPPPQASYPPLQASAQLAPKAPHHFLAPLSPQALRLPQDQRVGAWLVPAQLVNHQLVVPQHAVRQQRASQQDVPQATPAPLQWVTTSQRSTVPIRNLMVQAAWCRVHGS